MQQIYLSDLSHTIQGGLTSEFIPYGIGCIKSYYLNKGLYRDNYEITLFQNPNILFEAIIKRQPSVLAFSNYSWNRNLSYAIAEEAKRRAPEILVVFGGPNYPLDKAEKYKWLKRFPSVDVYITGEGEEPFMRVLDSWSEHHDIEQLKSQKIEGVEAISDGDVYMFSDPYRLKSLDEFPSPYVMGYLDDFLADQKLIPLTDTNRGCPFRCTFCEKGDTVWNAITRTSVSRFEEELHYIAQKAQSSLLMFADNNFGIFKEDEEIGKMMSETYNKYGYPLQLFTATSKTRYDRVSKAIDALKGRMPVTLSVQSLDDDVLRNIKRKNLPLENMAEASDNTVGSRSRSEMILGLPGDTRGKHIKGLCDLMDIGISFLLDYTLILLDGSELNTIESREKWKFKTNFRVNHRCYGSYKFGDTLLNVAEFEEVVTETETMTFEDYLYCREFYFTVSVFYMDEINIELISALKKWGVEPSDFIRHIDTHGRCHFSSKLKDLYRRFSLYTRQELREEAEDLYAEFLSKEDSELLADDVELVGMGGFNVIFTLRAEALLELVEDIVEVSFRSARDLIGDVMWAEHHEFLLELKDYVQKRKTNIFDHEAKYEGVYHYDYINYERDRFKIIPLRREETITLSFFHSREQKLLFGSFPGGKAGAARVLPKLSVPRMFRSLEEVRRRSRLRA